MQLRMSLVAAPVVIIFADPRCSLADSVVSFSSVKTYVSQRSALNSCCVGTLSSACICAEFRQETQWLTVS